MTHDEIIAIRTALDMTQGQLAQLLGVHSLTVSKWERGLLRPTPHQEALLRAASSAAQRAPGIGAAVVGALVGAGVGLALLQLLRAAFDPAAPSRSGAAVAADAAARRRPRGRARPRRSR
jgi:putative transcriptional regulator